MGTRMDFPSWAPPEVVRHLRDEIAEHSAFLQEFVEHESSAGHEVPKSILEEPEPGIEMLCRLITHADMRIAWETIKEHSIDPMLVTYACKLGFIGPTGLRLLPPSEREDRVRDIRMTAKKLAALVHLTEYDEILISEWQKKRAGTVFETAAAALVGEPVPRDTSAKFMPGFLSDLLLQVAKFDPSTDWEIGSQRPRGAEASRHEFIRRLDQLFLEKSGKRLRATVARFASAAFDTDIGERQVIRIAP